jgi:creatinine amidohydrolase
MRLQDLNWMDVERYLQHDDRIILVTGATEQHAYLSLLTDVLIPHRLALAVAEREKVLVAPPLNFGISPMFVSFPGTISLSRETFASLLTEVVQSLMGQGFNGFLFLNGHRNHVLPRQIEDLQHDQFARFTWHDWWQSQALLAFEQEHQLRIEHANWSESFAFTRVAELPEGTKTPVNLGYVEAGQTIREVLQDGSLGGPYEIDPAQMQTLFDRLVDEIAGLVQALKAH